MVKYKIPETGNYTLKQCRLLLNLTQREAAQIIGITEDKLSNYEREITFPTVPIIKKIEKAYNIPYSRIIFLTKDCG